MTKLEIVAQGTTGATAIEVLQHIDFVDWTKTLLQLIIGFITLYKLITVSKNENNGSNK